MAPSRRIRQAKRPHVALLVETSLISGREILRGIAHYVRDHAPWAVFHEPRAQKTAMPTWLKTRRGDGVIARLTTGRLPKRFDKPACRWSMSWERRRAACPFGPR